MLAFARVSPHARARLRAARRRCHGAACRTTRPRSLLPHRSRAADDDRRAAASVRDDVPLEAIDAGGLGPARRRPAVRSRTPFCSRSTPPAARSPRTGWTPALPDRVAGGALVGAMPLYAKAHSYGEYVFDWGWADAYRRHGRRYYPKLLAAIPFTPVPGPRLLAARDECAGRCSMQRWRSSTTASHRRCTCCSRARRGRARRGAGHDRRATACSSTGPIPAIATSPISWRAFSHDKRKKVKQDRRRVADAGVAFAACPAPRSPPPTGRSSAIATRAPTARITRRPI